MDFNLEEDIEFNLEQYLQDIEDDKEEEKKNEKVVEKVESEPHFTSIKEENDFLDKDNQKKLEELNNILKQQNAILRAHINMREVELKLIQTKY